MLKVGRRGGVTAVQLLCTITLHHGKKCEAEKVKGEGVEGDKDIESGKEGRVIEEEKDLEAEKEGRVLEEDRKM